MLVQNKCEAMKRHFYLLITIWLFLSCNSSNQNTNTPKEIGYDTERIQRIADVQKEMIDNELIGSNQVIIYKNGERIYNQVVNSGRVGDGDITEETLFPLWSMSKPITTVAVMMLFEEGKFMLDDPIGKYLPELDSLQCLDSSGVSYPCKQPVLIRHLLTHKSGWSYYPGMSDGKFYLVTDTAFTDLEDFSMKMAEKPLLFEPGTKYEYGLNTALLGRLIDVVSGQFFYDFLKERIFDPLEMPNTKFGLSENERKRLQPLLRLNDSSPGFYSGEFDELSYQKGLTVKLGGEGLISTATDYSHFCEMLLNDGIYNGTRLLSPASIGWMHEPQTIESGFPGFDSGFTFFHLSNPIRDGGLSPEGIFGWGGYHSTWFWIDQKNDLFGLIMTRKTPFSTSLFKKVRIAAYQSIY
jgi:CubicO group peptidase (beta-lactamase class C family)